MVIPRIGTALLVSNRAAVEALVFRLAESIDTETDHRVRLGYIRAFVAAQKELRALTLADRPEVPPEPVEPAATPPAGLAAVLDELASARARKIGGSAHAG